MTQRAFMQQKLPGQGWIPNALISMLTWQPGKQACSWPKPLGKADSNRIAMELNGVLRQLKFAVDIFAQCHEARGSYCRGAKHCIAFMAAAPSELSPGKHARVLLMAELSLLATMVVLAARATAAATRKATSLHNKPLLVHMVICNQDTFTPITACILTWCGNLKLHVIFLYLRDATLL